MIALDTNVLARFYIEERDAQARKQHIATKRVMSQPALFVPRTVVLELEWVMRGGYGYAREEIAGVIEHLLGLSNVTVENWEMVSDATNAYRAGMDFADALHLAAANACESMLSFDKKFSKAAAKLKLRPQMAALS